MRLLCLRAPAGGALGEDPTVLLLPLLLRLQSWPPSLAARVTGRCQGGSAGSERASEGEREGGRLPPPAFARDSPGWPRCEQQQRRRRQGPD